MKLNKIISAIVAIGFLASCNKGGEPQEPISRVEQISATSQGALLSSISLDADINLDEEDNKTRSLSYTIGPDGTKRELLSELPLYSMCIISTEDGTTRHYLKLKWEKVPGQSHYYVKKTNALDLNNQQIILDPQKKWFIKGYLTYNESNIIGRNVKYNPNIQNGANTQLKSLSEGESYKMDIPLHFDWKPLSLTENGTNAVTTNPDRSMADKIVIKPFGVMMRIKVTNQEAYPVKVKSLRLLSSVITPKVGSVNSEMCSAPNVPASQQTVPYYPDNDSNDHVMNLDASVTLQTGQSHNKYYLVWGMPKSPVSSTVKRQTHLLANVARLDQGGREMTYPKMNTLYVWGSDSNNPKHQSRRLIHAQVYRPKVVLEYMSDGYLTTQNTFAPKNTATTPLLKVSYPMLVARPLPAGYRILATEDARALAPTQGTNDLKFAGNNMVATTNSSFLINGVTAQYNETLQSGATIYGLRFDDGKDNRRQYSAWRYSSTGVIEVVYLGPNFKGDFDDIRQPEFWTLHQNDIIKRTYGPEGTRYIGLNGAPLPETDPNDINYTKEKAEANRNEALALLTWVNPVNNVQRIFINNLSMLKGGAKAPQDFKAFTFVTFDLQYLKAEQIAPAILMQNHSNFPAN